MTQTLPDLTRPTVWRIHIRLMWGPTVAHEFEGKFPEDALEAACSSGIALHRIARAEFKLLDAEEWRELPSQYLQEAIVLVEESACGR